MKYLLVSVLLLNGCESSRQFGAMMWAQPACVLACVITQTIVADNTELATDREPAPAVAQQTPTNVNIYEDPVVVEK